MKLTDLSSILLHNSPAFLANSAKFMFGNRSLILCRFLFIQIKYEDIFFLGCPGALVVLFFFLLTVFLLEAVVFRVEFEADFLFFATGFLAVDFRFRGRGRGWLLMDPTKAET